MMNGADGDGDDDVSSCQQYRVHDAGDVALDILSL